MVDYIHIVTGLGGALFGGLFRDLLDRLWVRADKRVDVAAQIRHELWEEIANLRERIDGYDEKIMELERQGTEWREKYFQLLGNYSKLEAKYCLTEARCEALEREVGCLRTIIKSYHQEGEKPCASPNS
ncbi:MAG TPA: hypothetical protein VNP04_13690 [Alphaproteobacteria bacterium]|nr:hypothetical protein [Alphaproteobacteria bacterium]